MRKFINFIPLFLFILLYLAFASKSFAEPACSSSALDQTAKIYSDANGCHASTGLGFNTSGGSYVCGPVTCPGGSGGTQGRNCVFNDAGQCGTGFTNTIYGGLNPSDAEGGCHWNGAPRVACSSIIPYTHHVKAKVQKADGTPLPNVSVHVYDNGLGYNINTDSNGIADKASWSGDHVKIWTNDSNYDHNSSHPFDLTVNTNWACGSDIGWPPDPSQTKPPCLITQSGSPTPTPTPPVSPSPTSSPQAQVTLVLGLPAIGYNAIGGALPKHLTRHVIVNLYDASIAHPSDPGTNPLVTQNGIVTFDSTTGDANAGYFVSNSPIVFNLPSNPPANNQYKILVRVPQYLFQLAVNTTSTDPSQKYIFTLIGGTNVSSSPFALLPGDAFVANGGRNHLNLDDYNQILTCLQNSSDSTCKKTSDGIAFADLDDDGSIDIVDLNLWLRSLNQLQKANAPGCSTGDCQGD